jgi:hypothetical protein
VADTLVALAALPLALAVGIGPVDVDRRWRQTELLGDLSRGQSSSLKPLDLRHPFAAGVTLDRSSMYPLAGGPTGSIARR